MLDGHDFDSKKEKFEVLNKAIHLDLLLSYKDEGLNILVKELNNEIRNKDLISGRKRLIKTQIQVLICNLVRAQNTKNKWLALDRAKNRFTFNKNCRYKAQSLVTYKIVKVVDALVKAEYLFQHKGYSHENLGGYRTRIRCTDKLVKMLETQNITSHLIVHAETQECIILRSNKKAIPYEDNRHTNRMRRELTAYNNVLRNNLIHIPTVKDQTLFIKGEACYPFNNFQLFTVRSFNDDFSKGGRYYRNAVVTLPKAWRSRLRINNRPIVEIDFSAMHLILLYAYALKQDYWLSRDNETDPYLFGYSDILRVEYGFSDIDHKPIRKLIKSFFMYAINTKSKDEALKVLKHKQKSLWTQIEQIIIEKNVSCTVEDLLERFLIKHAPIKDHIFTNAGINLQNIDSRISEKVIFNFTKKNIPVYNLHDSNIAQTRYKTLLIKEMDFAYKSVMKEITGKDFVSPRTTDVHGGLLKDIADNEARCEMQIEYENYTKKNKTSLDREYQTLLNQHREVVGRKKNYYQALSLNVRTKNRKYW